MILILGSIGQVLGLVLAILLLLWLCAMVFGQAS